MLKPQRLFAVFHARNLEFVRDRANLGWNFLMPVLIVIGLSLSLSEQSERYTIGVYPPQALQQEFAFLNTDYSAFIGVAEREAAIRKVERHQLDLLVAPSEQRYWVNDSSPNGYILERVLRGSGGAGFERQTVSGAGVRYVDWVIPGILAMNMMFSSLYGVGYVIVRYRKNGVLKRLRATPLGAVEFLIAQVLSRLWMLLLVSFIVYLITDSLLDFTMRGSYLALSLIFLFGAFTLISLGLIIAARIANEELAGGLVNLIGWPMMFLSGVWFSLESAHPAVQQLAQALPLTHLINGARAVMIDGAGVLDIAPHLLILSLMSVLFLSLGAWLFRWE